MVLKGHSALDVVLHAIPQQCTCCNAHSLLTPSELLCCCHGCHGPLVGFVVVVKGQVTCASSPEQLAMYNRHSVHMLLRSLLSITARHTRYSYHLAWDSSCFYHYCCCCCWRCCCCRWHLYDLLANRSAWWAPGKTLELRRRLKPYWQVCVSILTASCSWNTCSGLAVCCPHWQVPAVALTADDAWRPAAPHLVALSNAPHRTCA
jgi:hypothetical protein